MFQRKRQLMEEQRAQLAALQQQQQKARGTWSGQHLVQAASSGASTGTKSLLEIQQEQAKQEMLNIQQQQKTTATVTSQVSNIIL